MQPFLWPDNAPGRFAVAGDCICCSVCSDIAPENFRLSDEDHHNICYSQPRSAEELADCLEALAACPVEVIIDRS